MQIPQQIEDTNMGVDLIWWGFLWLKVFWDFNFEDGGGVAEINRRLGRGNTKFST